jgi:hypothetical protein
MRIQNLQKANIFLKAKLKELEECKSLIAVSMGRGGLTRGGGAD